MRFCLPRSAILAHLLLDEKLNAFGLLGCVLCIAGSLTIVLHAPPERQLDSVLQLWRLAMQPMFLTYAFFATAAVIYLVYYSAPVHGTTNVLVYVAICSLAGSLTVISCKALGMALKMTLEVRAGKLESWNAAAEYLPLPCAAQKHSKAAFEFHMRSFG